MLDDIVNKYNNAVHITIKMRPTYVMGDSYAEYNEDFNHRDPKFKVGDHVRISKCKNIFAKGNTPNWSEEIFAISKIKDTVPWTYVINDLNGEEFNKLAADVFNPRIPQANLITKTDFDAKSLICQFLTEKLLKIKQNIYLLKMN